MQDAWKVIVLVMMLFIGERRVFVIFTQMSTKLGNQIGTPDLIILFTNTVSHKMVKCAVAEAKKTNTRIIRCHTSSGSALTEILETACC